MWFTDTMHSSIVATTFLVINVLFCAVSRPEPISYANIILRMIGYKFGENNAGII